MFSSVTFYSIYAQFSFYVITHSRIDQETKYFTVFQLNKNAMYFVRLGIVLYPLNNKYQFSSEKEEED
jgi:hypothetical protein